MGIVDIWAEVHGRRTTMIEILTSKSRSGEHPGRLLFLGHAVGGAILKSKTYDEFVEKFKPKLTTDDCMTPPSIYEVVKNWACQKYGIDPEKIARPFWPGGDYERFDYLEGCVVLDNPPFSILSKICAFYLERDIPFFLFAPSLTAFSGKSVVMRTNHIICDADIVYENGAVVRTSFMSSYGGDLVAQTAPDLSAEINREAERLRREKVKCLPKYEYPWHIVTAALLQKYCHHGVDFKIRRSECVRVPRLDEQKDFGKTIFGGGLLLSDEAARRHEEAARAAAEKAAAERAAARVWRLSEREKEIVRSLGDQSNDFARP